MYKNYNHTVLAEDINDKDFILCLDSDLEFWLDYVAFPKCYRSDITAAIVKTGNADLVSMWVSESNHPYTNDAIYHPLPFYRPTRYAEKRMPSYWQKGNKDYER